MHYLLRCKKRNQVRWKIRKGVNDKNLNTDGRLNRQNVSLKTELSGTILAQQRKTWIFLASPKVAPKHDRKDYINKQERIRGSN